MGRRAIASSLAVLLVGCASRGKTTQDVIEPREPGGLDIHVKTPAYDTTQKYVTGSSKGVWLGGSFALSKAYQKASDTSYTSYGNVSPLGGGFGGYATTGGADLEWWFSHNFALSVGFHLGTLALSSLYKDGAGKPIKDSLNDWRYVSMSLPAVLLLRFGTENSSHCPLLGLGVHITKDLSGFRRTNSTSNYTLYGDELETRFWLRAFLGTDIRLSRSAFLRPHLGYEYNFSGKDPATGISGLGQRWFGGLLLKFYLFW